MAKGTFKVGGGVNPMHLSDSAHPFGSAGGRRATSKFAKTTGVGSNPGGGGDKVSANSAMKGRRKLNGPGTA